LLEAKTRRPRIDKDVNSWTALRDRSGILFSAGVLQRQPSTRGEALRDFAEALKRYKRIARPTSNGWLRLPFEVGNAQNNSKN